MLLSPDLLDDSCCVATASLGGETNLKTHAAVPGTAVSQRVDTLVAGTSASRSTLVQIHGMDGNNSINGRSCKTSGARVSCFVEPDLKHKRNFGCCCMLNTVMETKMALNYKSKSQK